MSESTESSKSQSYGKRVRFRLLIPICLLGVCAGMLAVMMGGEESFTTVSQVTRSIRQRILFGSDAYDYEQGGQIGPWWIAADTGDELTGEYTNFRLQSKDLHLAAKRALLVVDPIEDTICFELTEVVFMRTPTGYDGEPEGEQFLHTTDFYTLGPVPYGEDIVSDGDISAAQPSILIPGKNMPDV